MYNRHKVFWLDEIGRPNVTNPTANKDKGSNIASEKSKSKSKKSKKSSAEPVSK
jgi:hypothetical protein